MQRTAAITFAICFAVLAAGTVCAEEASRIGKQIPDFELRDYLGKTHKLSDYADSKVIVVAFLGTDCPLVKLYAPRLEEMANDYAEHGVTLIGINSNRHDPPTKVGAYARMYGMTFPILKDSDNRVADVFEAIRTPEMFVLDEDRVVRYWGRIDDQYGFTSGVGYGKPKMTRNDLGDAIDDLLAGREVRVPVTEAPGCIIGRVPTVEPHGDITYTKHIAEIMQNRCAECHRDGQIAPFPLTSYDEVVGWAEMINEVVDQGRMPPWYANPEHGQFANDPTLSAEEKTLIAQWVKNGMPEGDPSDLPEPRHFAEGWGIPEPDAVFYMSEEPYKVAATGVIDYQYFTVDPGFTEDKWIKAVEARPGNLAVVHHIICFIQEPGNAVSRETGNTTSDSSRAAQEQAAELREEEEDEEESPSGRGGGFRRRGALIGYAPGMQPRVYPDGIAVRVPAGSKFVFQMHYTPVGTEQLDRSSVGMVFADEDEIRQELRGGVVGTLSINIPPGDPDHVIETSHRLRRDTMILSLMPHMHVRGKSFRYEAEYPDGTREVILDVPQYDFNWQLWYDLAEPKLLPAGTRLECTARYDNSPDNVYNPDPTETVRFGDQTWEEMMFGFYAAVDPHEDLTKQPNKRKRLARKPTVDN